MNRPQEELVTLFVAFVILAALLVPMTYYIGQISQHECGPDHNEVCTSDY